MNEVNEENEEQVYDVAIVGSGHNGLVCACYLAKAGLRVIVLERRHVVGGAVCTEDDLIPGYKIDVGSSAHIMIHLTPVVQELELEKFGLDYLDCDPFAFAPLADGSGAIYFWRDVERTCESIARVSPPDAERYRDFVREWGQLNEGVFEAFLKPPTLRNLGRHAFLPHLKRRKAGVNSMALVQKLMSSYGALVKETFEHEGLRAAMTWLAAQSGPPPTAMMSGDFVGWHAMLHRSGLKRPRGGSGALTQALARCLEHHGGCVRVSAPVARIEVENKAVTGVRLAGGERIAARRVVSNAHVMTTLLHLVGAENLPNGLAQRVKNIRVGNGFGMVVRCAMSALPHYTAAPSLNGCAEDCHKGLQLLCPSPSYIDHAYADYLAGRPSTNPAAVAMTFSAVDPTLAPEGRHVLFIWGQYYPYEMANGARWDSIAEREADRLVDVVNQYAPNVRDAVLHRFVQTPLDIEQRFGLLRGNVMHVEMEFDQMFFFRPLPELSAYRTPIKNLYLTGASTHPGGGVFAASGRNTAQVVLGDVQGGWKRKLWRVWNGGRAGDRA